MASCQKLSAIAKPEDQATESEHLLKIAKLISDRWPGEREAEEALNTLIPLLIRANRLEEAQHYVEQIPKTSPHRGLAEFKTGQALWSDYLSCARECRELKMQLTEGEVRGYPEGKT